MARSLQLTYSTVVGGNETNHSLLLLLLLLLLIEQHPSTVGVFLSTRRQTLVGYLDLEKKTIERRENKLRAFLILLSYIM